MMKKWILYGIWGCLYVLCAVSGFLVTDPSSRQQWALFLLSLLFFAPPALLLVDAYRFKEQKTFLLLRWISGLSLALTLVLLVTNLLSALGSEALGTAVYHILVLVSVPMICSQRWFFILFLWACVFFATLGQKKK